MTGLRGGLDPLNVIRVEPDRHDAALGVALRELRASDLLWLLLS